MVLSFTFFLIGGTNAQAGTITFFKNVKKNYIVKIGGVAVKKKRVTPDLSRMYADAGLTATDAVSRGSWVSNNWAFITAGVFIGLFTGNQEIRPDLPAAGASN